MNVVFHLEGKGIIGINMKNNTEYKTWLWFLFKLKQVED